MGLVRTSLFIAVIVILSVVSTPAQPKPQLNRDPKSVRFITTDIDNFWRAYDLAAKETDEAKKVAIFKTEYLEKGSDGLKSFDLLRIRGAENLVKTIGKLPNYYASIRPSTLRISGMKKQILEAFKRLKAIYPDAVFPDVYFVIGRASSGGTTGPPGLLIGAEMYGLNEKSPKQELGTWLSAVLKPVEDIPGIVAHELAHYEQDDGDQNTLLGRCLREGGADMIGQLISKKNINTAAYAYGDANESRLWIEFQTDSVTNKSDNWLYNGGNIKDRPADLGYYIGYKICEAYYKRTADKSKAISDILHIKDPVAFLKLSGYDMSRN